MNFSQIKKHEVNMSHIESRPSKSCKTQYDFFVDCENLQGPKLTKFVDDLKDQAVSLTIHSEEGGGMLIFTNPLKILYNKVKNEYFENGSCYLALM